MNGDVGVLSTNWRPTVGLVDGLADIGLGTGPVVAWGETMGYLYLTRFRPTLLLLDLPRPVDPVGLVRYLRAAMLLAPVVVTAPPGADVISGLEAGAVDVLDRNAPAVELAARISALRRRLALARHRPDVAAERRGQPELRPSQRLLSDLLARGRPVCCHQLRWLLGTPGRPLALGVLKPRLARLETAMRARGASVTGHRGWGVSNYQVTGPMSGSELPPQAAM